MGWLIAAGGLALPVMEIVAWVRLAEVIGVWGVIGLTLAAVLFGVMLLRGLGPAMLMNAHARLRQGEVPLAEAFNGLCLAAAGVLLILPGLISDALGLLLLLPAVRRLVLRAMAARLVMVSPELNRGASGPVTIDGDFQVVEPEPDPRTKRLEP